MITTVDQMPPMDVLLTLLLAHSEGYHSILFNAIINAGPTTSPFDIVTQYVRHVWNTPVRIEIADGYLKLWPDWGAWRGFSLTDIMAVPHMSMLLSLALTREGFETVHLEGADLTRARAAGCRSDDYAAAVISECRWAALETALSACQCRIHDADVSISLLHVFNSAVYALQDPEVFRVWSSWEKHCPPFRYTHEVMDECISATAAIADMMRLPDGLCLATPRTEVMRAESTTSSSSADVRRSQSSPRADMRRSQSSPMGAIYKGRWLSEEEVVLNRRMVLYKKTGRLFKAEEIRRTLERMSLEAAGT